MAESWGARDPETQRAAVWQLSPSRASSSPDRLLAQAEKRLTVLNGFAVFRRDFGNDTATFGFDFVHDLHRLDNADDGVFGDLLAHRNVRWRIWRRRGIERPDHRGRDLGKGFLCLRRRCGTTGRRSCGSGQSDGGGRNYGLEI